MSARCALLPLIVLLARNVLGISVQGLATRRAKYSAEYWVEGSSVFTNAFSNADAETGGRDNSVVFKGTNWHGFSSKGCAYSGSWTTTPLAAIFDALRAKGFNAIRVPLAVAGCPADTMDRLDDFIQTGGRHGMLILLTIETMRSGVPNDTGYIGGDDGFEQVRGGWEVLASRFCDPNKFWNVVKLHPRGPQLCARLSACCQTPVTYLAYPPWFARHTSYSLT